MSSHYTQRSIALHHRQVDQGRARRAARQRTRLDTFIENRSQIIQDVSLWNFATGALMLLWVVGFMFITISYTNWLVK